jgi:hypothetical protein
MPDNRPSVDAAVYDVADGDLVKDVDRHLEELFVVLANLCYADDAAKETYELLCILKQARIRAEVIQGRLKDVWIWLWKWSEYRTGEDTFKKVLEEYRVGKKG